MINPGRAARTPSRDVPAPCRSCPVWWRGGWRRTTPPWDRWPRRRIRLENAWAIRQAVVVSETRCSGEVAATQRPIVAPRSVRPRSSSAEACSGIGSSAMRPYTTRAPPGDSKLEQVCAETHHRSDPALPRRCGHRSDHAPHRASRDLRSPPPGTSGKRSRRCCAVSALRTKLIVAMWWLLRSAVSQSAHRAAGSVVEDDAVVAGSEVLLGFAAQHKHRQGIDEQSGRRPRRKPSRERAPRTARPR